MAENKNLMIPPQGGVIRDFIIRLRLIVRLLGDRRVSPWLKFIPVLGLAYLVWPVDLIPGALVPILGEMDDLAVVWMTNYVFVELCPPEIVQQHVNALTSRPSTAQDEVIEAESVEIKEDKPQ